MKIRYELQPHRLKDELQRARVVTSFEQPSLPVTAVTKPGLLQSLRTLWRRRALPVAIPIATGVPHGVTNAKVKARNIRVFAGDVYFCPSKDYMVLAHTLAGADGGVYPPYDRSEMTIGCPVPPDGMYDIQMTVSVNGSTCVHIERFDEAAEPLQPASVGA